VFTLAFWTNVVDVILTSLGSAAVSALVILSDDTFQGSDQKFHKIGMSFPRFPFPLYSY
jgi:hypothetical protein